MTQQQLFHVVYNTATQVEWDAWLAVQETDTVLQSWNWKILQEAAGRTVTTARVFDSAGECVAQTLLVTTRQVFGMPILFSPRGPIIADHVRMAADSLPVMQAIIEQLAIDIAVQFPHALCWRFEPALEIGESIDPVRYWPRIPGRQVSDTEPAWTRWLICTGESIDTLLSQMKQKTRYNIRLATKKGVVVKHLFRDQVDAAEWNAMIDQWILLQDDTAQRHGISHHGAPYYNAFFHAPWSGNFVSVLQAEYNGEVLAMNVLLHDTNSYQLTYLFGASSGRHGEVMAPYALQFAAMKWAIENRCSVYDFYGIAPEAKESGHPLSSVTRFKNGFGGRVVRYPGTFDFPIHSVWYRIYRLVKRFR